MAEPGLDLESVARLIQLAESRGLRELIVEEGEERIIIRRDAGALAGDGGALAAAPSSGAGVPSADAVPTSGVAEPEGVPVVAPMVGVFYTAQAPDQPPFVEPGDRVEIGQTIGLIEAMKVFSEVPSDVAGICTRVAAASGQLVQMGDPLIYVAPDPAIG